MDLERDLFTVTVAGVGPSEADMIAAVEGEGFEATIWRRGEAPGPASGTNQPRSGAMPALVQEALDRASREGKLVLLDFYADWCGPCLRMLEETYKDPQVAVALERFVFLKVDTDDHPQVARYFGVAGIPDGRILQADGTELTRFLGFKDASEILTLLTAAR